MRFECSSKLAECNVRLSQLHGLADCSILEVQQQRTSDRQDVCIGNLLHSCTGHASMSYHSSHRRPVTDTRLTIYRQIMYYSRTVLSVGPISSTQPNPTQPTTYNPIELHTIRQFQSQSVKVYQVLLNNQYLSLSGYQVLLQQSQEAYQIGHDPTQLTKNLKISTQPMHGQLCAGMYRLWSQTSCSYYTCLRYQATYLRYRLPFVTFIWSRYPSFNSGVARISKLGGTPRVPSPSLPPLPSPFFSLPLLPSSSSFPFPSHRSRPLKYQLGSLGERCNLPQWGLSRSPMQPKSNLVHFSLKILK